MSWLPGIPVAFLPWLWTKHWNTESGLPPAPKASEDRLARQVLNGYACRWRVESGERPRDRDAPRARLSFGVPVYDALTTSDEYP